MDWCFKRFWAPSATNDQEFCEREYPTVLCHEPLAQELRLTLHSSKRMKMLLDFRDSALAQFLTGNWQRESGMNNIFAIFLHPVVVLVIVSRLNYAGLRRLIQLFRIDGF